VHQANKNPLERSSKSNGEANNRENVVFLPPFFPPFLSSLVEEMVEETAT